MTMTTMNLAAVVLAVIALVATSSVFVDAQYRRPTSYRRRHLTPYDAVCLGTAAPTTLVIPAPVPGPAPQPTPKGPTGGGGGKGGKGGGTVSGPTSKTGPVPCPPSKSGGSGSKSGPSPSKSGPPPARSGPSPNKSGPSPSKSGPSPSKSGPSPSRSGPSPSKSGPAPGCRRFLQMAAATLGFHVVQNNKQPVTEIEDSLSQTTPLSASTTTSMSTTSTTFTYISMEQEQRALQQIITLNSTFLPFGSYPLSSSFTGFALFTWPNLCFTATIEVTNFIPNCVGCSFVVTDGAHTCVASSIPAVVPFIDPTEIPYNPYTNSTFFNTDANGNGVVTVNNLCTGTGPVDNYERPLLLLDPSGVIAACGRLKYQCQ